MTLAQFDVKYKTWAFGELELLGVLVICLEFMGSVKLRELKR